MIESVIDWWNRLTGIEAWLLIFGLVAQSMFFMRFLVQWIMSERARRSVVPEMFWYFSITGGILMFIYGVLREDPVIMLGQSTGIFIYARNLYFIWREKRQAAALVPDRPKGGAPGRSAPHEVMSTPVNTTSAKPLSTSRRICSTTTPAGTDRELPRP